VRGGGWEVLRTTHSKIAKLENKLGGGGLGGGGGGALEVSIIL